MPKITGGELLLRCLHAENIAHVHAITDGTYMMVIEAIERLGNELGIKLIVPRHEAAAAHACDAYTRVSGKPAVVMACAGPGELFRTRMNSVFTRPACRELWPTARRISCWPWGPDWES